jgi:hypothetical protein
MLTTTDALEAIRRLAADSHPTPLTGARMGQMLRAVLPGFSPAALGVPNLAALLRAAAERGYVDLDTTGSDVQVRCKPTQHSRSPRRVRRDLWVAFVEWDPIGQPVFDRKTMRAVTLPLAAVEAEPDRFERITPCTNEQQLRWRREWAESLAPADGERLLGALGRKQALKLFKAELEQGSDLKRQWAAVLAARVGEHIERWLEANGLPRGLAWEPVDEPTNRRSINSATADRDLVLRAALHRVIDAMPTEDLARILLPASAILDRNTQLSSQETTNENVDQQRSRTG